MYVDVSTLAWQQLEAWWIWTQDDTQSIDYSDVLEKVQNRK